MIMTNQLKLLLPILAVLLQAACGYYQAPVAPLFFAPAPVKNLAFKIQEEAIVLNWESPDKDIQGEDLKYIKGYRVERIGPVANQEEVSEESFALLSLVPDKHLKVKKKLRNQAIKDGDVSRKVKVPAELKSFEFIDTDLQLGSMYLYRIIPYYSRAKGGFDQMILLDYQGSESKFGLIRVNKTI